MSLDDDLTKAVTEAIMQDASFKLGDVINSYPPAVHVLVLVIMQRMVDTIKLLIPESDRELFDHQLSNTNVITAPTALDPRKREGDG